MYIYTYVEVLRKVSEKVPEETKVEKNGWGNYKKL